MFFHGIIAGFTYLNMQINHTTSSIVICGLA